MGIPASCYNPPIKELITGVMNGSALGKVPKLIHLKMGGGIHNLIADTGDVLCHDLTVVFHGHYDEGMDEHHHGLSVRQTLGHDVDHQRVLIVKRTLLTAEHPQCKEHSGHMKITPVNGHPLAPEVHGRERF